MSLMGFLDKYFIKQPRIRRLTTRLLEGDKDTDIHILGAKFRINTIKEHGLLRSSRIANSSLVYRHEAPIIINIASLINSGDSFVDVGANIGLYSFSLARLSRIKHDLKFYAFEANPDTFSRLRVHADELGVQIFNTALAETDGEQEFVAGAVSHVFTNSRNISQYSIPTEKTIIDCKRLDSFEIKGDSLVIKIDVEGQELSVLKGSRRFFEERRVKAVYLDGYKDKEVEFFLKCFGFKFYDGQTLEPIKDGVFCLLALHPDKIELP